jgi:hypothetical protein
MSEHQNPSQNPNPANLSPDEPAVYEQALSAAIRDAHAELEDQVGYPLLVDSLVGCTNDAEVEEAFEGYAPGLKEHATDVEAVLSNWGRRAPKILEQHKGDWDVFDEVSSRIGENGFDSGDQFDPLEAASSDEARQVIKLSQDHAVLSEAQGLLEHELPSPDEFAAFVENNASSAQVAQAIRTALDWDVWDLLPKNEHGQVFTTEEKEARASLLAYVSGPGVRQDMELALEEYEARVRGEQYRVVDALRTKLGNAALQKAVRSQMDSDPRHN